MGILQYAFFDFIAPCTTKGIQPKTRSCYLQWSEGEKMPEKMVESGAVRVFSVKQVEFFTMSSSVYVSEN